MSFLRWTEMVEKEKKRKAQFKKAITITIAIIMPFGLMMLTLYAVVRRMIK